MSFWTVHPFYEKGGHLTYFCQNVSVCVCDKFWVESWFCFSLNELNECPGKFPGNVTHVNVVVEVLFLFLHSNIYEMKCSKEIVKKIEIIEKKMINNDLKLNLQNNLLKS